MALTPLANLADEADEMTAAELIELLKEIPPETKLGAAQIGRRAENCRASALYSIVGIEPLPGDNEPPRALLDIRFKALFEAFF